LSVMAVVISVVVFLAGCQSEPAAPVPSTVESNQATESQPTENENAGAIAEEEPNELFADISKYQFVFSSGVGAWQTMLTIHEDGTFEGYYSDSDMGVTGEDYPNGVIYSSTFAGKFTTPERVNDYTYSMSIETMQLEHEAGSEEIIDGIKYIYCEPNGLDDATEIYVYTTQAPLKELPEGFRSWVGYAWLDDTKDEYLPFYGLYNIDTESGFSSYMLDETVRTD